MQLDRRAGETSRFIGTLRILLAGPKRLRAVVIDISRRLAHQFGEQRVDRREQRRSAAEIRLQMDHAAELRAPAAGSEFFHSPKEPLDIGQAKPIDALLDV